MKWTDKIRLAWHSISLHKLKTAFTGCIVFLISLLAMTIWCLAISLVDVIHTNYEIEVLEQGITIDYQKQSNIPEYEFNALQRIAEKHEDKIKHVAGYANRFSCYDFRYTSFDFVDESLSNTAAIYLNESFQEDYAVGDIYSKEGFSFTVAGFFQDDNQDCFIDLSYAQKHMNLITFQIEVQILDNYNKMVSNAKEVYQEFSNQGLNKTIYSCAILERINESDSLNAIVLSFAIIIFIIIIFISISYIINSIFISLDENKEFLKMLEILGLHKKTTLQILLLECFFPIFLGVVFAYGGLFVIKSILKNALAVLVSLVAPGLSKDNIVIAMSCPVYVPFLCLGCILLFTIVFTLISSKRISGNYKLTLISNNQ